MYPELTTPLLVLVGGAAGLILFLLIRRPVLRRLALRQVMRRPTEGVLVILGSLLGTALIVASFVVGDSLNRSVRQSAYDVLGPVDEYVRSSSVALGDQVDRRLQPLRRRQQLRIVRREQGRQDRHRDDQREADRRGSDDRRARGHRHRRGRDHRDGDRIGARGPA